MKGIVVALIFAALPAVAQTTVNQGQGQSSGSKPWTIQGSTSSSANPVPTTANIAALTAGETTEVLVTNGAGGTTVPAVAFANRRSIEIQNNGPNPIYCTVDGTAPVATTSGRWVLSGQAWSLDIGPLIIVKCIAGTAAQLTGAATMVTELR